MEEPASFSVAKHDKTSAQKFFGIGSGTWNMRATLTYTLPDEQAEFDAAINGRKAFLALWEIDQRCRGLLKHGEPSGETRQLAEEIRQLIRDECAEALES